MGISKMGRDTGILLQVRYDSNLRRRIKAPLMAEEIPNIVVTVTVEDPNLQTSNGLLPRLFNNSKRHAVRGDYLNCIQSEVLPWMRKQLVQWMLEVCEEQKLSIYVFPQATHLLDRYLSEVKIKKTELQLVGVACLFIASKLRECIPLATSVCVMYTDNSIKEDQLLEMELLLLTFYKWDVLACLSVDLVLPILNEFELHTETNDLKNKVRSLLDLCLIENEFLPFNYVIQTASTILIFVSSCALDMENRDAKKLAKITGEKSIYLLTC